MRSSILLFVAFAVTSSAPSFAADKDAAPAATPAKDKMICRRDAPTGSLIQSRKICHTASQWQKVSEDAQRELERMNPHITTEHGN